MKTELLRDYQIEAIRGIFDVVRAGKPALCVCSTGCLSGDTLITVNRNKDSERIRIDKAFHSFKKTWRKDIKTYTRSFITDKNRIGLNEIIDIVYSGEKKLYLLELKNGLKLKATKDHKIMTKRGFVKLGNLLDDDLIMVDSRLPKKSHGENKKYDTHVGNLKYHKFARHIIVRNKKYKRVEKHRAIYEAHINGISLDEYKIILRTSLKKSKELKFIDPNVFHIHHIDGNHYNNEISNLKCLSKEDHLREHSVASYKNFSQGIPRFSGIKKITSLGIEKTYDIYCEYPNNSFVANDIVVHNSGKGRIFSQIIAFARERNKKVLLIVNKLMLVDNAIKEIKLFLSDVSRFTGKEKRLSDLTVATIQSLYNVDHAEKFDIIIWDEAHSFDMESMKLKFKKDVIHMGFTATPFRFNNLIYGEGKFWTLAYKKNIKELTDQGFLVPITYYGQKDETAFNIDGVKVNGDDYVLSDLQKKIEDQPEKIRLQVEDALKKSKNRKKIIVITCGITHAEIVHSMLENAVLLHSQMNEEGRAKSWDAFTKGDARYLVSVLIASEGLDIPAADCMWFFRPTRSARLYIQAAGRILRLFKDKVDGLFLDYGKVFLNLGHVYEIKIENNGFTKKKPKEVLQCPICDRILEVTVNKCPDCGYTFLSKCSICGAEYPKGECCLNGCSDPLKLTKGLTDTAFCGEKKTFIFDSPVFSVSPYKGPKSECLKVVTMGLINSVTWYIPSFKYKYFSDKLKCDLPFDQLVDLNEFAVILQEAFNKKIKEINFDKEGKYYRFKSLLLK